jgi:ribonuclease BN (tRNA processing enzyme)
MVRRKSDANTGSDCNRRSLYCTYNHCDILIHEVYSPQSQAPMPDWPKYRALYHTSTLELADIARQTQPGLLILYHRTGAQTGLPDEQYLSEVRQGWEGKVVVGHDLEMY